MQCCCCSMQGISTAPTPYNFMWLLGALEGLWCKASSDTHCCSLTRSSAVANKQIQQGCPNKQPKIAFLRFQSPVGKCSVTTASWWARRCEALGPIRESAMRSFLTQSIAQAGLWLQALWVIILSYSPPPYTSFFNANDYFIQWKLLWNCQSLPIQMEQPTMVWPNLGTDWTGVHGEGGGREDITITLSHGFILYMTHLRVRWNIEGLSQNKWLCLIQTDCEATNKHLNCMLTRKY